MTTYKGLDVLEAPPNTRDTPSDGQSRGLGLHDPGLGARSVILQDDQPGLTKPYVWTCIGKPAVAAFKDWLRARAGQAVPFWLPSWRKDLLLAQDVAPSATGVSIQACGYTRHLFPSPARRHLVFWTGAAIAYREVLAAVDQGATETLTLSSSLGFAFPRPRWISILHLVRLASDEVEIAWKTDEVAEASLSFVEVPEEVP